MLNLNQKGIAHILVILILLVGMIAGVYLVQHPQIFKPRASGGNTFQLVDKDGNSITTTSDPNVYFKIILPSEWTISSSQTLRSNDFSIVKTVYGQQGNCQSDCKACPTANNFGTTTYDSCEDDAGGKSGPNTANNLCQTGGKQFRCFAWENNNCASTSPGVYTYSCPSSAKPIIQPTPTPQVSTSLCKADCKLCPTALTFGTTTYDTCEDNLLQRSKNLCSNGATGFRCFANDNNNCASSAPGNYSYQCPKSPNQTVPLPTLTPTPQPSSPNTTVHVLKDLYIENKDTDGSSGGHEQFHVTSNFQDYLYKPIYWKLNDLNPNQQSAERVVQLTLFDGTNYIPFTTTVTLTNQTSTGSFGSRTASILKLPFRSDTYCFQDKNKDKPECVKYYVSRCVGQYCNKELACDKYYNPVVGQDGYFYPTACWAEALGTTVGKYGYSDQMMQFFKDLWLINLDSGSYGVPYPEISFAYNTVGGAPGLLGGTYFRSTLWLNSKNELSREFYIDAGFFNNDFSKETTLPSNGYGASPTTTILPTHGVTADVLLAFVDYDSSYPHDVVTKWVKYYENFVNDYLKKKQQVTDPIRYIFHPVFVNPPDNSNNYTYFSDAIKSVIYNSALSQLPEAKNYKVFVVVPIKLQATGGFQTTWNGKDFIESPLGPSKPYSIVDEKSGIGALAAFQSMMLVLSHEVIHSIGMSSDHMELSYTRFLEADSQYLDFITGKRKESTDSCTFLATSPDYYAAQLPSELKIKVGQEPDWLYKIKNDTGDCLLSNEFHIYLKDFYKNGEYEIMYNNNMIDNNMQQLLGWVDIDGDGIAEIADPNPYGGLKILNPGTLVITDHTTAVLGFNALGEVTQGGCKFEKAHLENGQEGLVPLACAEFNDYIVNLYEGMKYYWKIVKKNYGNVFLPD